MSERSDTDLINDIREAIARISNYIGEMPYSEFLLDGKTQDAVIRNIEIVGEATKGISEKTRLQHPGISWKSMAGMRGRLIHHYFGVNLDIVWHAIKKELPAIRHSLSKIIYEEPDIE